MQPTAQIVDRALPIVASAFTSGNSNIDVTVGGTTSYTDYTKINVAWNDPFDKDYAVKAFGYVVHEVGHLEHTDKDAKLAILHDPIAMAFYRSLEDVRMEKETMTKRPGRRKYLSDLVEALVKHPTSGFETVSDDDEENSIMAKYVLYRLRNDILRQTALSQFADDAETRCREVFPKGLMIRLDASIFQVSTTKDTQEVVTLCQDIADMLREESEKEDEPESNQDDDSNSQSDDSQDENSNTQSDSDSEDEQDSDDSNSGDDQNEDDANSQSDSDSENDKTSNDDSGNSLNDSNSQSDSDDEESDDEKQARQQTLKQAVSGNWDDVQNDIGDLIEDIMNNEAQEYQRQSGGFSGMPTAMTPRDGLGDHHDIMMKAMAASNALSTQLSNLIEASVLDDEISCLQGELDTSQLHRFALKDLDIFSEEIETQEVSTSVRILLDRSGSMYHDISLASQAVLAIGLALEKIQNVNVGVSAFPGDSYDQILSLTSNKEKVSQTVTRYSLGVDGTTPLAEAMWFGLKELCDTNEDRKMMMVITDGEPNDSEQTEYMIDLMEKNNIEVMAIGINSHSVQHYFKNHIVISDISELATSMFAMLKPLLVYHNE